MASRKEYELAVKIVGLVDASLGNAMERTKKETRKLANEALKAAGNTADFQESMKAAGPGIDKAWNGVTKAAKLGAGAMTAAGTAAVIAGKSALDTGSEFEKAMSDWKGTANATEAEYKTVREAAMEMGRITTKTATESANAMEYMALAGWSVEDSVKALPGVLKLSEATNLDLARTSDLVTDSMSATGVEIGKNGEGLKRFLDIAAQANRSSNQTAEQLMTAWIKTGGVFSNLGVDVADSATALGILANRGFKAEEAGTKLRAIMINLTAGGGEAGKMLAKLGIEAFDSRGKFVGLRNLMSQVNDKTKDLTEEERNAAFAALGGKRHVDGLNDLMQGLNNTLENGKSEWDDLRQKLEESQGALENMANTKMDNLWGDQKILQSAIADTKIRIYEGMRIPLRDATKEMTKLVYGAGDFADTLQYSYPTLKRQFKDLAKEAKGLLEPMEGMAGFASKNPQAILSPAAGVVASIATIKGVKTVNEALLGKNGLLTTIKMLAASTGGKIAIGVTVAAGAIAAIKTAKDIYDYQQKEKSLLAHFGSMQLNSAELDMLSRSILGEERIQQAEELERQLEKLRNRSGEFEEAYQNYNQYSWKVKLGAELSEEEVESLKGNIDSMVESANQYIEEKQYAVHLSVQMLFGDSAAGEGIEHSVNAAYAQIQGDLTEQSKLLGDAMAKALEDGMIALDEQKLIDSYVETIGKIRAKIEESEQNAKFERIEAEHGGALTKESYKNLKQELNGQTEEANAGIDKGTETTLQGLRLALENGTLTPEAYEANVHNTVVAGTYRKNQNNSRAALFNVNSLNEAYGKEMEEAREKTESTLYDEIYNDEDSKKQTAAILALTDKEAFARKMRRNTPKATRDALKDVWDKEGFMNLLVSRDEMHKAGYEIGEEMQQAILDGAMQGAMTGDADAAWEVMKDQAKNSPKYREILRTMEKNGMHIPKELADAIRENSGETLRSVDELVRMLDGYIRDSFSNPFYANGNIRVQWQTENTYTSSKSPNHMTNEEYTSWRRDLNKGKVPKRFAKGGRVDSPELSLIGEGGDREYVIPINRSQRSLELLHSAQRDLQSIGVSPSGERRSISFSPQFIVQGNADRSVVESVMENAMERFRQLMSGYQREEQRLSY